MKELLILDIRMKYSNLIPNEIQGKLRGDCLIRIEVDTSSPLYDEIQRTNHYVRKELKDVFFFGWNYKRIYTEEELKDARLFKMSVRKYFEPCGRDCGTVYDTSHVCEICKSGEKQVSPLYTRKGSYLNNRDVASTISYEIVVTKRFVEFVNDYSLRGLTFGPVYIGKRLSPDIFQLMSQGCELDFSERSVFGIGPFDFTERCTTEGIFYGEVYKCPKGDNLGGDLLSDAFVKDCDEIEQYDFFISRQTIGVYRGLINQYHVLFCSPRMRSLMLENKIRGFNFEVANVV